jgi:ligand-binding SRPBCC domain-containing protein
MPTYHRETWVDAPLSDVWAFHATTDGLVEVTPAFVDLSVDAVTGPDGEADPDELVEGTRIELGARPVDALPRLSWTSVIVDREEGEDRAFFRDRMEDGPFPLWVHEHRFYGETVASERQGGTAADERTLVSDRVTYRLPGGQLGDRVAEYATLGFDQGFAYRHRRTKELLEADGGG